MRAYLSDLEADGLLDAATRVHCGVFKCMHTGEVQSFTDPAAIVDFMDTCDVLVMHNGYGYDFPLLKRLYGYEFKGKKIDTLLMSRLQKPHRSHVMGCKRGPHSIEAWGMRLGRHKPEHEDWSEFSPEMLHRCEEDVEILSLTLAALLDEGRGYDWKAAHRSTGRLFETLQKQEEYGWLVDQPYMSKCLHQLTTWMDRINNKVRPSLPYITIKAKHKKGVYDYYKKPFTKAGKYQRYCLEYFDTVGWNPDTCDVVGPFSRVDFRIIELGAKDEIKDYLLAQGWIPKEWNSNNKGERTSPKMNKDDPYEGVARGVPQLVVKWVQCRNRRGTIEGWVRDLRPDGRVAQGIAGIATTGRLRHKRLVNVPGSGSFYGKQMRKIFKCKEGYKIVGVDADACQNRALAARVQDDAFTKTLLDGKKEDRTSIHYVNMAAIKEVAGLDVSYKISKNLNYGWMFGASDNKLASVAGVAAGKGPLIREALLSVSPGLESLLACLQKEWEGTAKRRRGKWGMEHYGGSITGIDGRPIFIEHGHCLLVYMLQSDEAIIMQNALLLLEGMCEAKGWKHGEEYGYVANVHDEINTEIREDLSEEFADMSERAIAEAGALLGSYCPHKGEAKIGDTWYDVH